MTPSGFDYVGGLTSSEVFEAGLLEGYVDRYALGSDRIRVGGIENIIEFNGSRINETRNADAVVITSIDGLSDADVRDNRELNPGYDGETAFSANYGGRTIVLNGFIRSGTLNKLRNMQEGLKRIFSPLEERPLVFRGLNNTKHLQIYCRKSQPITMTEVQQNFEFKREFQVTLRASDFRFTSVFQESQSWTPASQIATGGPETVEFGNVTNLGSYFADPIIKIAGPITSNSNGALGITIANNIAQSVGGYSTSASAEITGEKTYGLSVDDNDQLKINAASGSTSVVNNQHFLIVDISKKTIKKFTNAGNFVESVYGQLNKDSEWIKLAPGSNPISVYCSGPSTPTITFYYRHTFI